MEDGVGSELLEFLNHVIVFIEQLSSVLNRLVDLASNSGAGLAVGSLTVLIFILIVVSIFLFFLKFISTIVKPLLWMMTFLGIMRKKVVVKDAMSKFRRPGTAYGSFIDKIYSSITGYRLDIILQSPELEFRCFRCIGMSFFVSFSYIFFGFLVFMLSRGGDGVDSVRFDGHFVFSMMFSLFIAFAVFILDRGIILQFHYNKQGVGNNSLFSIANIASRLFLAVLISYSVSGFIGVFIMKSQIDRIMSEEVSALGAVSVSTVNYKAKIGDLDKLKSDIDKKMSEEKYVANYEQCVASRDIKLEPSNIPECIKLQDYSKSSGSSVVFPVDPFMSMRQASNCLDSIYRMETNPRSSRSEDLTCRICSTNQGCSSMAYSKLPSRRPGSNAVAAQNRKTEIDKIITERSTSLNEKLLSIEESKKEELSVIEKQIINLREKVENEESTYNLRKSDHLYRHGVLMKSSFDEPLTVGAASLMIFVLLLFIELMPIILKIAFDTPFYYSIIRESYQSYEEVKEQLIQHSAPDYSGEEDSKVSKLKEWLSSVLDWLKNLWSGAKDASFARPADM